MCCSPLCPDLRTICGFQFLHYHLHLSAEGEGTPLMCYH
jgi:hypothetical protein